MLGKTEGRMRRGQQTMRWLDGITSSRTWVWANSRRWWRTEEPGVLQSMGSQRVGHDLVTEQQQRKNLQIRGEKKCKSPNNLSALFFSKKERELGKKQGRGLVENVFFFTLYFQEVWNVYSNNKFPSEKRCWFMLSHFPYTIQDESFSMLGPPLNY